ncbi:MAG: flavodoxin family protein [Candidatus Hodarchaeales archaeon]
MAKILLINGSPLKKKEKSNTRTLLQEVAEGAQDTSSASFELIDLADYAIQQCNGCAACVKGACPLSKNDDMPKLEAKLLNADAIILGSPSYWAGPSGILKNFMDRSRPLKMPESKLTNKLASAVATAGLRIGGQEHVVSACIQWALGHGMLIVGASHDPYRTAPFPMGTISYETPEKKHRFRDVRDDSMAIADAQALGKRIAKLAQQFAAK